MVNLSVDISLVVEGVLACILKEPVHATLLVALIELFSCPLANRTIFCRITFFHPTFAVRIIALFRGR